MNVEIVVNKKALSNVRNQKKELKDLYSHTWESDNETSTNVVDALESIDELETNLDQTKESMYKLSYVVRVSAKNLDELKRGCDELKRLVIMTSLSISKLKWLFYLVIIHFTGILY